jgi:hypothetical protein
LDVSLRIQDPSGTVVRDVHLRAEETHNVRDLIEALVGVLEWPRDSLAGELIVYYLRRLGTDRVLDSSLLVTALGLAQGETLVLGPRG